MPIKTGLVVLLDDSSGRFRNSEACRTFALPTAKLSSNGLEDLKRTGLLSRVEKLSLDKTIPITFPLEPSKEARLVALAKSKGVSADEPGHR